MKDQRKTEIRVGITVMIGLILFSMDTWDGQKISVLYSNEKVTTLILKMLQDWKSAIM